MALKRYDPDEAEFDARYQRWLAALESGDRVLSVYYGIDGERFWVITESDRSATTVLLPDEY